MIGAISTMLSRTQRLFFDLNGYVLLRHVFAAEECHELLAITKRLPVDQGNASVRQTVLANPAWTERRVLEVAMDPRLRYIAEDVIGGEARLEETQFLIFAAEAPTIGSADLTPLPVRWHRGLSPDYGSFESEGHYHCLFVKALVYLTPQICPTGTWVVPGSHRQTIAIGEFARLADPGLTRCVEAGEGDVLLFGETLIHGSPPGPLARDRVLLVIAYCAPFMRSWSAETAPPASLPYPLSPAERRFVYGEARYDFRAKYL